MWNHEASPKPRTDGTPQPPTAAPTIASRPLDERRVVAGIGRSVIIKGHLSSAEDLTIDGRVEGTIELRDHDLTIGAETDVQADIFAKTVTVRGTVTGKITASDKVNV